MAGEGRVGADIALYGLHHTVAMILREAGLDEQTKEMARPYAKGADLGPKMRAVSDAGRGAHAAESDELNLWKSSSRRRCMHCGRL